MRKRISGVQRGGRHPGTLRPLAWAVAMALSAPAWANPTGAQVAAGAASFATTGKTLTVTNAPGTIINWQSFNIAAGETTRFQQQSALSAVLNRVTGGDPSSILGALTSNGRVFLVNPHGIVFGQGSVINTAGFVASTLNISDADFLAGRMKFEGGGNGLLRNEGAIRASGDIFLVGPQIENAGLIQSENGSVVLAAGKSLTITSPDAHGVQFALQAPTDAVLNIGAIEAKNAAALFAGTLRHSGDIRVTSASVDASGRVVLSAQKDAIVDGNALISLDNSSGRGGRVEITGERVGLFDNATISARGASGGGEILIGGDYQGANPDVRNAARTYVGNGVTLDASATTNGEGGRIIVWADDVTRYFGHAAVQGGTLGGNGGLVEVSGKNVLNFHGTVGLDAPLGAGGTLLLDPLNITVQAAAGTLDGELSVPGDPTLAFADASGATGTLGVASLQAFTTGTVELQATNNITFDAAVTMQSGVSLKAAAMNNINVNANITTSGGGVLRLEADTDQSGAGVVNLGSATVTAPMFIGDTGKAFSGNANISGNFTFGGNTQVFGKLTYNSNAMTVASGQTLTLTGGMNWSAATTAMSGSGTITLPAGQTLAITASSNQTLSNLTLNNNGTVTMAIGGNSLFVNNSAVINNAGVFRFLDGSLVNVNVGPGTFNNTGEVEVGGAFTGRIANVTFTNTGGTLDSGTGTLSLEAGGSHSGALTMQGNNVNLSGGTHNFADSTTIAGRINVVTGGTASFGTVTANGLVNYTGGAINVTTGDTLTLNSGMNWATTNTISGPGAITLPSGQTLALTVNGDHALSGLTLNNNGTVTTAIGGGQVFVSNSSVVNNAGTFRLGDVINVNSGTGTFNNTGTLEVSGSSTATVNNVTFNNTAGTLNSGSGTLNMASGGNHSGALTISGANVRLTDGTHNFADSTTIAGQLNVAGGTASFGTVTANGLVNYTSGAINVTTGDTLTLNSGMNWATTNTISGPGTITLPSGQTLALTVSGDHSLSGLTLNNNGTVTTAIGGGQVLVNNSSVINNAGTFRMASDLINVGNGTGTFNNTGTLEVSGSSTASVNNVTFNNTGGTLNSGGGTLNMASGGNHSGALTISGTNVRLTAGTHNFADSTTIAGQLNVAGGTASFGTVTANGLVNFTGGNMNVTTGDTLTLSSGMNWATTNTISGPGTITLPSGQTMALTVSGDHSLSGLTLNNNGTLTTAIGGGQVLVNNSSVINNAGTFRMASDLINVGNGTGTFNNTGTLEVSGSSTASVNNVTFNNNGGTLNSGSGTLNINSGGSHTGTTTISGTAVNFTAGTRNVSGTITAGTGSSFKVGGATFNFGDGSALNLADNLNFTSGAINLTGTGTGTTINAGSTLTLSSQSFGGSGKLTNKGTFNAATTTLGGVFVNEGAFNVTSGNATVTGGMTSLSGTTTVGTGRTLTVAGSGVGWQGGTLAGAGTYNLTGGLTVSGSGARVLNGPTFTINNLNLPGGSLDVQGGTLNLTGAASTTSGATLQVSGGTLTSTGTFANAGTLTKTSTGTTTLAGALTNTGTVNANAGTLHFNGGYTDSGGALVLGGGSVTAPAAGLVFNTGQLRGTGTITGNLTHNGTVSVGSSPGTMTVAGNLTLGAGSTLNIELGGTTQGSNYDLLQVTGTASLNGTMNVTLFGGFTGAVGNVFDVITYASQSGNFSTVNFPSGYTMSATPNATFFQLLMSGVPAVVSAAARAEILKLPAADSKVLLEKFLGTVTPDKAPEDDEKKGAVLECS